MILSRPPIVVSTDPQKSPKTAVNSLSPEAGTTLEVKDRGHELRHPSTKKFQSREKGLGLTSYDASSAESVKDKRVTPKNEY